MEPQTSKSKRTPWPGRPTTAARYLLPVVLFAAFAAGLDGAHADPAPGDPPPAFREVLGDPRITEALIWDGAWPDGSGPRPYARWGPERQAELHARLAARERGGPAAAAPEPPPLEDGRWLSSEAAWGVFLAHAAHALWVEAHREVPWSLRSLTPDQAALLLDGRHLLEREPGGSRYAFGPSGAVATWTPEPVFSFLRDHGLLAATQEETVYSLADWVRRSIPPLSTRPSPTGGLSALHATDRMLARAAAGRAGVAGCRELSGLLAAALRSANVPVRVAESPFAHRGSEPALHSRIELPTLGRGLAHSSELLTPLALPSGNAIPTAALFPTLGWVRDHVESPQEPDCVAGACHTAAEQALFNCARRVLALAAVHLPDGLLMDRAGDPSASVPPDRLLETLASGCAGHPAPAFVRPLFDDAERREIARRADEEIVRTGGGDWERGAETVRERWQRLLDER